MKPITNHENLMARVGGNLVKSGLDELKSAQQGAQRAIALGMMGGGAVVWAYGKIHGLASPYIQRGAVAAVKKLAEQGLISQQAVPSAAAAAAILGTILVMPAAAVAADDVLEAGLSIIQSALD